MGRVDLELVFISLAAMFVAVARTWRRPIAEKTTQGMVEEISAVAPSPWIAVVAAGAGLTG